MRIRHLFVLCIATLCALCAKAQSATQTLVPETQNWRVHLGDDPAYASPAFDDSAWATVNMGDRLPSDLAAGRSRWFRKRIALLPQQSSPIDLIVTTDSGSYEVYVDGRRITPPVQSSLRWQHNVTSIYPLSSPTGVSVHEVEVAIRSHLYNQVFMLATTPAFVAVATPTAASTYKKAADGSSLGFSAFPVAVNFILVLAGILLIILYLQQRGYNEYLWLGLSVISAGLTSGLYSAAIYLPISWNAFLGDPCTYWTMAAQLEFVYVFIGRRPHRAVRIYQWALFAIPFFTSPLGFSGLFPVASYGWFENGVLLPGIVLVLAVLVRWALRGNREAGLLLGPMFLANVSGFLVDVDVTLIYLNPSYSGIPALHIGLVQLDYWTATNALFLLAVGLVIFLRFVRVSREQVVIQTELESARAIQHVLIPEAVEEVPGFRIESVYHPAQQVGGDFFQVIPLAGGGVLAVVGDVSGKGIPAALTVALIVGTLRTLAETTTSPAEILAGLNRRLVGRSAGFTTCLAVRILPDGEATLASAGHLNPYLNSPDAAPNEVTSTIGLPLGLAAEAEYSDLRLAMQPGETLTMLSDGVVEARNTSGELLGFERARTLSAHPADQIAQAAESFGQEDDITVLSVTLAAPEPVSA